jgi:hypothetical protein
MYYTGITICIISDLTVTKSYQHLQRMNEKSIKMKNKEYHNVRRVWRYQREVIRISIEQTTQWPKEKGQKEKQRSTKHTHKTKDRITQTH